MKWRRKIGVDNLTTFPALQEYKHLASEANDRV